MHTTRRRLAPTMILAAALTGIGALPALAFGAPSGSTTAVPGEPANEQVALVNETGTQPTGTKSHFEGTSQVASYDGSSVVFSTDAALVPWDTNGTEDVYLRFRPDDITILVSSMKKRVGNGASFWPTISEDGRYVAYATYATNLARGTSGDAIDIVFRDMQSTATTLVSRGRNGAAASKNSLFPVIAGNGMSVSFQTESRLSAKDRDRTTDVYAHDLRVGTTQQVSLLPGRGGRDVRGHVLNGDVSHDGRFVTFGNNTNLWVRDLREQRTRRFHQEPGTAPCNDGHAGSAGRPAISGNGRYAAFSTCAVELVGQDGAADIFRIDLRTGERVRVTEGNGHSYLPSLSRSGRYLGFGSDASDLVVGDDEGQSDAFWADVSTGMKRRASQGPDGAGGNRRSASVGAAISGRGDVIAYQSYASNLVAGDISDYEEVFTWMAATP